MAFSGSDSTPLGDRTMDRPDYESGDDYRKIPTGFSQSYRSTRTRPIVSLDVPGHTDSTGQYWPAVTVTMPVAAVQTEQDSGLYLAIGDGEVCYLPLATEQCNHVLDLLELIAARLEEDAD